MNFKRIECISYPIDSDNKQGVLVHELEYNPNGDILLDATYTDEGMFNSKIIHEYDEKNQLAKTINYLDTNEISEDITFVRNAEGLIKETHILYNDGSKTLKKHAYSNNNLTEKIEIFDEENTIEGKETITYNANQDIIEHIEYDENNQQILRIVSSYNEQNKIIGRKEYDEKNELTSQYKYIYNDKLLLIEQLGLNSKNEIISKIMYAYDDKNRELKQQIDDTYLVRFEYDDEKKIKIEERFYGSGTLFYQSEQKFDENDLLVEEIKFNNKITYKYTFYN